MKFTKICHTSITSCPIIKEISYYQKLNPIKIEDDFVFDIYKKDKYLTNYYKYITLARQSVLKAFYTIELEYLKYLLKDLLDQYNIITFYAYRFNLNTIYPFICPYNGTLYFDNVKQIEQCSFDPTPSCLLSPELIIDDVFTDIEYIKNYEQLTYKVMKDPNEDVIRFNTFFVLAYIELSNDNDKFLIFPFDKYNNILQRLRISDSYIDNTKDFNIEVNFYTDNSFIKMYEYDYKKNKNLYLINYFKDNSTYQER